MTFKHYWDLTERIVKSRDSTRQIIKYDYVEKLWKALSDEDTKLIFLRAPTGIGKTETVLVPHLYQYVANDFTWWSLVYVLPTRSLVTNMYTRFCRTVFSILKDILGGPIVTLDYGSPFIVKPYLEGDIVVTTYDTLIYTMYGLRSLGRHYRLPLAKLTGALIVLDEVQLMQDIYWYTPCILPKHISFLVNYAYKVIVMSATLPTELVESIKNEVSGYLREDEIIEINCLDEAKRGDVIAKVIKDDIDNVLSDLIEKEEIQKMAPLLVVCNTVKKAVDLYLKYSDKLEDLGFETVLLHSRLRFSVREEREKVFEGERKENLVLIATQVVEAGIDYSFKGIITECCPIDSLIQRIGRIARKPNNIGIAFISINTQTLKNASRVYGEDLIQRTKDIVINHERELDKAVKNSSISTRLVDELYTRELIELLSKKYRTLAHYKRSIASFIGKLLDEGGLLFDQRILKYEYSKVLNYLVRLGVEIKSVLPTDELRSVIPEVISEGEKILSNGVKDLKKILGDIDSNMVKLSLRVPFKELKIPQALLHKYNDGEYIVTVDVIEKSKVKLTSYDIKRFKRINDFYNAILAKVLVLNPDFYEFKDNYDLGVVRL